MMDMNGMMNTMMAFGWVGFLLSVALLALIIFGLARLLSGRGSEHNAFNAGKRRDALDSARRSYARGDVSREEFEEIKRTFE